MCKFGYVVKGTSDGNYECVKGQAALAVAMAGNTTAEEIEAVLEAQAHSDRMVTYNVIIGALWACAGVSFLVTAGFLVVRKLRKSKVKNTDYNEIMNYNQLLG